MSKPKENQQQASPEAELFADTNITMKTGHLTKDAEIVGEGKFVKIRIAGNKQYLGEKDEVNTITNYFTALVSGNLKEAFAVAKELHKGDWVYLKGEDRTKSFDTPEGYKETACTIFPYKVVLKRKSKNGDDQKQDKPGTADQGTPAPA